MDVFIGQIVPVPYTFAPQGYAFCNGQLMAISQNTALFSLLGTTYGGDGRTTFALPDLRGRIPIGSGQGPGLQDYFLGQSAGEETVLLNNAEMAAHTHQVVTLSGGRGVPVDTASPVNATWDLSTIEKTFLTSGTRVGMSPAAIGPAGGNQPHGNMQPYLTLNFIIALQGIFPARS